MRPDAATPPTTTDPNLDLDLILGALIPGNDKDNNC